MEVDGPLVPFLFIVATLSVVACFWSFFRIDAALRKHPDEYKVVGWQVIEGYWRYAWSSRGRALDDPILTRRLDNYRNAQLFTWGGGVCSDIDIGVARLVSVKSTSAVHPARTFAMSDETVSRGAISDPASHLRACAG